MITQRDRDIARGIDKILSQYKQWSFSDTEPPDWDGDERKEIRPYFCIRGSFPREQKTYQTIKYVSPELIERGYIGLSEIVDMVVRDMAGSLMNILVEKTV